MAYKQEIEHKHLSNQTKVKQKIWTYSWDLMAVDDLSKHIVLDPLIGFSSHKIDEKKFLDCDVSSKIKELFQCYSPVNCRNISKLQEELFNLVKDYKLLYKFNIQYLSWLKLMVKSYLQVVSVESAVNIEECNRYQGDNYKGVKISANKFIIKGTTLHILTGYYKSVDNATCQFLASQNLDFSIMKSNMKSFDVIMLGPAALINHDCNPNCEYMSSSKETIKIKTLNNIQAGEELLCYYGHNFFGEDNQECACRSCEQNEKGYYKQVNRILDYSQSLSLSDLGTNKNISITSHIESFSQADPIEKCSIMEVNLNKMSYKIGILKNIFSFDLMQLNMLYYLLDEYLKFDDKILHISDMFNDQTDIIFSVDIYSLIKKINHCRQILMLGPAYGNRYCQEDCMRRSEPLELVSVDQDICKEDNDGFVGFSYYTKLEIKLDRAFVKLIRINPINYQYEQKYVSTTSEDPLENLQLCRPNVGWLFCIYCDEFKTQLPRHLVLQHSDKAFVKNFLINFEKKSNKLAALAFIRNQGFGHYHELTGKIIPVYCVRKDSQKDVIKVQCSNCFAHFSEETFQIHLKECTKFNVIEMKNKGLL